MIFVVKKWRAISLVGLLLLFTVIFSINVLKNDYSSDAAAINNNTKTVIIDAGHGGEDPGAVSDYSGAKEKDINLNIALKTKKLLEKEKYKVIMTRQEDKLEYSSETTNIVKKRKEDLLRRKKIMDEGGADIVVSIHLNKFPQTQYFGAQVFYPKNPPQSQKLAVNIQNELRAKIDPTNTREALEKKETIIILKDSKTPTAIVECGFLSNEVEEKKLISPEYQDKLAAAIKDGIKNYFTK